MRNLLTLTLIIAALSLSACGGGKKLSTKDNSVEYRTALALPPLKKPSRDVIVSSPEPAVEELVPAVESSITNTAPDKALDTPIAQTSDISTSLVTLKTGQTRLKLVADFDPAWDYLSLSLQQSGLTVFSRNKEGGRFSIGCGDIGAEPTDVKRGRWSFFNRKKKRRNSEHCALQVVEKRGTTTVSLLNRAGDEVSSEYSNTLFSNIINN